MAYVEDWRARSRNQPEMREMQARAWSKTGEVHEIQKETQKKQRKPNWH